MVDRNMCVSLDGSRNDSLDSAEVYYLSWTRVRARKWAHCNHMDVCAVEEKFIVGVAVALLLIISLSPFSFSNHPLVFNWNSLSLPLSLSVFLSFVFFFFRFRILCHTNFGGWNGNLNNFKIYWTVRSNKKNVLGTFIHMHICGIIYVIHSYILWINDCNECVDMLLLAFIFAHHIVFNMHCSLWSEYSSTLLHTHMHMHRI